MCWRSETPRLILVRASSRRAYTLGDATANSLLPDVEESINVIIEFSLLTLSFPKTHCPLRLAPELEPLLIFKLIFPQLSSDVSLFSTNRIACCVQLMALIGHLCPSSCLSVISKASLLRGVVPRNVTGPKFENFKGFPIDLPINPPVIGVHWRKHTHPLK